MILLLILSFLALFRVASADAGPNQLQPAILLVPGAFMYAGVYDKVVPILKEAGFQVDSINLPSAGNVVGRESDIKSVKSLLDQYLTKGRDVLLVGNSYGATVIGQAVQGSQGYPTPSSSRIRRDQSEYGHGRVLGLVYLAGWIPYISEVTQPGSKLDIKSASPPFFRYEYNEKVYSDGNMTNFPPQKTFYNLLPSQEADYWTSKLTFSSFTALNATATYIPYTGDFRVVYVVGNQDNTVTPATAQTYIDQPGAKFKVEYLDADHVMMLSKPDEVCALIQKYAERVDAW